MGRSSVGPCPGTTPRCGSAEPTAEGLVTARQAPSRRTDRGAPVGLRPAAVAAGPARLRAGRSAATTGPRVRRGDVRAAILDVLAVEPMNGYQIIQQIAERSGGAWKPSPGSVYPTVQQLEDEGLVEGTEGRRAAGCSADRGRPGYVEEHPDELAATWRAFDEAAAAEPAATATTSSR